MSRKEALTYEERISRLEMLLDSVLSKLNITYSVANAAGSTSDMGEFRGCDGALELKQQDGSKVAFGTDSMFWTRGFAHHVLDEATGSKLCSFGYSPSEGGFAVRVQNSTGEHDVIVVSPTSVSMPSIRESSLSSYDSVVVDSSGTVGIPASDIEKKRNIEPITGTLEKVLNIQPVRFRWKDTGKPAIGFINEQLKEHAGVRVHELISVVAILWQAVRELAERSA